MRCDHFEAGTCRSCTLLDVPRPRQIAAADASLRSLLAPFTTGPDVWSPPIRSADAGFRAKAKMVVSGTAQHPVLGIQQYPADLADCPLYPPEMEPLLEQVRALIRRAQVPPYDVARRRGEIKHVILTLSPTGEAMLRLVLRSEQALPRIREHLPALLAAAPAITVVSANILPEHRAVLEGAQEIPLAGEAFLPVPLPGTGIVLRARPQSFLQTNPAVAEQLYAQVAAWVADLGAPLRLWDLYCGIGGFALSCAGPGREVTGVEISAQAIVSARESAADAGLDARFHAADATAWAIAEAARTGAPDAVVVNPPRRGIGPELAGWIESSGVPHVIYSSCNPASLARDLAAMPSYRIVAGRLVDMFPHTGHEEAVVRLAVRDPGSRAGHGAGGLPPPHAIL